MYENYLLVPDAVVSVANAIAGFRPNPLALDEVKDFLESRRQQKKYFCKGTEKISSDWIQTIDGYKVLADIFQELSETRVTFQKTTHSILLTEWLLDNDREQLREIADLLLLILAKN